MSIATTRAPRSKSPRPALTLLQLPRLPDHQEWRDGPNVLVAYSWTEAEWDAIPIGWRPANALQFDNGTWLLLATKGQDIEYH